MHMAKQSTTIGTTAANVVRRDWKDNVSTYKEKRIETTYILKYNHFLDFEDTDTIK